MTMWHEDDDDDDMMMIFACSFFFVSSFCFIFHFHLDSVFSGVGYSISFIGARAMGVQIRSLGAYLRM